MTLDEIIDLAKTRKETNAEIAEIESKLSGGVDDGLLFYRDYLREQRGETAKVRVPEWIKEAARKAGKQFIRWANGELVSTERCMA